MSSNGLQLNSDKSQVLWCSTSRRQSQLPCTPLSVGGIPVVLVGLPAYLMRRLQSVQNASARLIYQLRPSDHISVALISLHWLRVPERIEYKMAVLVYKALNGLARYLGPLTRVADLPGRSALRSAGSSRLHIPHVRLPTVGTRAFSVAGPRIWNNLPDHITSAGSLHTFCYRLKTYLSQRTYS